MAPRASLVVSATLVLASGRAHAQASEFSLRFHGTGSNQQDRVRIRIDDDATGPDASAPCDVGACSFTIEVWLRGKLADNPAAGHGSGDVESTDESWRNGHVFLDRDIWGPSFRVVTWIDRPNDPKRR